MLFRLGKFPILLLIPKVVLLLIHHLLNFLGLEMLLEFEFRITGWTGIPIEIVSLCSMFAGKVLLLFEFLLPLFVLL